MKEEYLTRETGDHAINEMVKEITSHHYRHKPWKLYPEKTALLVLDMQNYFLDPSSHAFTPSATAVVPTINKLIDFASNLKMPVIFTKHVNDKYNAGMMGKWWWDLVPEGSWEAQIHKTVRLYDGKTVVKHQYDAFYNTDLEDFLRSKNIEHVIITGVLTNLCCETTARSAFVRGFEVLFPIDATAAYNREFHLSTFRNLGFGFCPIITTPELIHFLDENK
jgi:nicotinamidase-related amidase